MRRVCAALTLLVACCAPPSAGASAAIIATIVVIGIIGCIVYGMRERPRSVQGRQPPRRRARQRPHQLRRAHQLGAGTESLTGFVVLALAVAPVAQAAAGDVRRSAEGVRVERQLRSRAVHAGAPREHPAAHRHERPPGRRSGRRTDGDPALRASPGWGDGVRAQRAGRGLPGPDLVRVP